MQINSKINRYQHYDANSDRGYGRLEPKFHHSRAYQQYPEPLEYDEEAIEDVDDETYAAVVSRLLDYSPSDPYAKNSTDPFHFVDGATTMTETSVARGMVPFPKMYKSKQAVAGGTGPRGPGGPTLTFRTRSRPTGTKKGFSQAPYPEPSVVDTQPAKDLADILDDDSDQNHVDLIKRMVNLIHLEQEQQKVSS